MTRTTVKIQGGLGNQMFQYAFGRAYSLKHKTTLFLDTSLFKTYPHHTYGLNQYNTHAGIISDEEENAFIRMRPKSGRRHFFYNLLYADSKRYIIEQKSYFDASVITYRPNAFFDGYWQTERYFEEYSPIIRQDFKLNTPISPKTAILKQSIEKVNAVSLHVRRGLFVSHPIYSAVHGSCSIEYYTRAISKMTELVSDPHFFIFSDDQSWVKNNITPNFPTTYVDHTTSESPHEDIVLMSTCKHHIIANSSFSWWGAWLNSSESKIVIGPTRWLKKESYDASDVLPPSWIRLPN